MRPKTVFLYSNQPVVLYDGKYYTRMKNFIDFLAVLANTSDRYRLAVPCKLASSPPGGKFVQMELPADIIMLEYYEGHLKALLTGFKNVFKFLPSARKAARADEVVFAGPGPNSFLFWLSLFAPSGSRFAFFIRGDVLKTVSSIYRGQATHLPATSLVRLFRWRIRRLLESGRAQVFLYGEALRPQYPGAKGAVHVIYPLIDRSAVREDERPDIGEGRPLRVLFVGRFSSEKNVLALVRACGICKEEVELSLVGFGELEGEIRGLVEREGLSGKVRVLGYVPSGKKLFSIFDSHDLLCLPSLSEGVPRVMVEAFSRGMPVAATRVGSIEALFNDNAVFIEGFEAWNIAHTLDWCARNRKTLSAMGRDARPTVGRFLLEKNAVRVDEALSREDW